MAAKRGKILVVDDNAGIRNTLKILLPLYFAEVEAIASPGVIVSSLEKFHPDVVLLDMNFKTDVNNGHEGLYWTQEIKRISPATEVVLFTAYADIELAVEGMKRGAFDFIVKPWENEKLIAVLTAARDKVLAAREKIQQKVTRRPAAPSARMYWGNSRQMLTLRKTLEKIAPTDATILITGENGTGKDVLAREIHAESLRSNKPMVAVDAGAITETLFESELFGHVKGAFTDARSDHAGKFEQADGGTLFLDEIGNIPLHLQAKLLRALQSRCIVPVGGTTERPVDIRLICATNMDIGQMVSEGRFREDLYYRINMVHLELPPLRERREDILPLAERFIATYAEKYRRDVNGLDEAAKEMLKTYPWKGNIRELQHLIEKAVILSEGSQLHLSDLLSDGSGVSGAVQMRRVGEADEERLIRDAMERAQYNVSIAARMLGISRPTLYKKLKKYDL